MTAPKLYREPARGPRNAESYILSAEDRAVLDRLFKTMNQYEAGRLNTLLASDEDIGEDGPSESDFRLCRLVALESRDPEQIARICRSAERYRPKWDTKRGKTDLLGWNIQNALVKTEAEYAKRHREGLQWQPPSFTDLSILEQPDLEWVLAGLLPLGGLVQVVGRYGSAKTFVLLDWMLHIAAGMEWQGHAVKKGKPLYVYGEGAMKQRVAAWRSAHHVKPKETVGVTFMSGAVVNLLDDASVEAFLRFPDVQRRPPAIVFDTQSRYAPGDENSAEYGAQVVAACGRIQEATGALVILAHHTPWDPGTQRPKGSSKIPDCTDAIFLLENEDGQVTLTCQKMRDAERPSRIALKLTPVDGALVVDKGEHDPVLTQATKGSSGKTGARRDQLLFAMKDKTWTANALAGVLKRERRSVASDLAVLVDLKLVSITGTGRRNDPYLFRCKSSVAAV